jgi:hypothetical protein
LPAACDGDVSLQPRLSQREGGMLIGQGSNLFPYRMLHNCQYNSFWGHTLLSKKGE